MIKAEQLFGFFFGLNSMFNIKNYKVLKSLGVLTLYFFILIPIFVVTQYTTMKKSIRFWYALQDPAMLSTSFSFFTICNFIQL